MKKNIRCIPTCDLPYEDEKTTTRMMVKLFEDTPFLPNMIKVSKDDNLTAHTLMTTPGIFVRGGKPFYIDVDKNLKQQFVALDAAFNNPTLENLEPYAFDAVFLKQYFQILERVKPPKTVINLLGPFTIANALVTKDGTKFISDKFFRKLVIQAVTVKALWIINKIKEKSPETKPLIVIEEPKLNCAGDIKREFEEVTQDLLINLFNKVILKLKEAGAEVCVQCFEKCDWQIPIDAGADIISFDAYNNPNNLNIIAEKVNEFLARGGKINWAIVPSKNENLVKSINADNIFDRLVNTMEGLIIAGTSEKLTYNRALVSVQGSLNHLPLFFAEKALMVATQVAKRIPHKS